MARVSTPMDHSVAPCVAREQRSREIKVVVRESMTRHRASDRQTAITIGISDSLLAKRLDLGSDNQLLAGDLAGFPPAIQLDVLRHMANQLGYDLLELPEMLDAIGGVKAAARLLQEASFAAARLIAATEDDEAIDRREGAELEPKLDEIITIAATIRSWCRKAKREGVVNLRVVTVTEVA